MWSVPVEDAFCQFSGCFQRELLYIHLLPWCVGGRAQDPPTLPSSLLRPGNSQMLLSKPCYVNCMEWKREDSMSYTVCIWKMVCGLQHTTESHTWAGEDSWFLKGKQPTCEVILLYPEISSPPSWEKPKVSPDMDIGQKCLRARDIIKEVIHKCHLPTSSCTHSPYPYLYPTLLFLPETVGYPDVLEVDYRIIS